MHLRFYHPEQYHQGVYLQLLRDYLREEFEGFLNLKLFYIFFLYLPKSAVKQHFNIKKIFEIV